MNIKFSLKANLNPADDLGFDDLLQQKYNCFTEAERRINVDYQALPTTTKQGWKK